MSTASAKPEPSLKRIITHLKERSLLFDEDEEGHQYIEVGIEDAEQIIKALEAQPAAGRTALKELKEWLAKRASEQHNWAYVYHSDTAEAAGNAFDEVIRQIDAQERAGATA